MTLQLRLTARLTKYLLPALIPLLAVLGALVVGGVLLALVGADPLRVYEKLISGAAGSAYSRAQTLGKATPLLLIAVGVCIAFRARVLNIGVEGQVIVGGLAGTACAISLQSLPGGVVAIISICAAMAGGALWAAIPGILKAYFGVNEILSTIMMNQISGSLLIFLLTGPMKDTSAEATSANIIQSAAIPDGAWLLQLVPRSPFHVGAILAVIAAGLAYFLLWRTVLGYRIRAVGENPRASAYAGISVRRVTLTAMILSGALAGAAGGVEVLGVTHRALQDFTTGYGFSGIVVALFGGLHPIGAVPAAVLFGGLLVSGTKLQSVGVSSEMVTVLEGLIVLFVVSSGEVVRRLRRGLSTPHRAGPVSPVPQAAMPGAQTAAEG